MLITMLHNPHHLDILYILIKTLFQNIFLPFTIFQWPLLKYPPLHNFRPKPFELVHSLQSHRSYPPKSKYVQSTSVGLKPKAYAYHPPHPILSLNSIPKKTHTKPTVHNFNVTLIPQLHQSMHLLDNDGSHEIHKCIKRSRNRPLVGSYEIRNWVNKWKRYMDFSSSLAQRTVRSSQENGSLDAN